jgi:hypothetical protein
MHPHQVSCGLDQLDGNHASAPGLKVWISCWMFGGTMHSHPGLTIWISWMGTTHPHQASRFGSAGWEPRTRTRPRGLDQLDGNHASAPCLAVWISWMGTTHPHQASRFGSAVWELDAFSPRPHGLDQLDGNHASATGLAVWISWMGITNPQQASQSGSADGWLLEPRIRTMPHGLEL